MVKNSKRWYTDTKGKQMRADGGELYCVDSNKGARKAMRPSLIAML